MIQANHDSRFKVQCRGELRGGGDRWPRIGPRRQDLWLPGLLHDLRGLGGEARGSLGHGDGCGGQWRSGGLLLLLLLLRAGPASSFDWIFVNEIVQVFGIISHDEIFVT